MLMSEVQRRGQKRAAGGSSPSDRRPEKKLSDPAVLDTATFDSGRLRGRARFQAALAYQGRRGFPEKLEPFYHAGHPVSSWRQKLINGRENDFCNPQGILRGTRIGAARLVG